MPTSTGLNLLPAAPGSFVLDPFCSSVTTNFLSVYPELMPLPQAELPPAPGDLDKSPGAEAGTTSHPYGSFRFYCFIACDHFLPPALGFSPKGLVLSFFLEGFLPPTCLLPPDSQAHLSFVPVSLPCPQHLLITQVLGLCLALPAQRTSELPPAPNLQQLLIL